MLSVLRINQIYLSGDAETAAKYYFEAAREGDAQAAFNYGYCLYRGIGVVRDPAQAKSFFTFARDLPGGEAQYNLAVMYMHGDGVPKDFKKAIDYMRFSAERGCVEAALYLGMAYTTGAVFEPDIDGITMIPFHKAEYRDSAVGLLTGMTAEEAEAEEEARSFVLNADPREAFEWFRRAAHADPTYAESLVATGKFLYARCYVDGFGTEFNRDAGIRLMLAAGKSGSAEATAFLAEHGITEERFLASAGKKEGRNG